MKAHIARNQNAGIPLALGWNLSAADRGILEGMAPAFGMKLLLVSPADAGRTVAQLLGEVEVKTTRTLVLEPGAYPPALVLANFKDKDVDTLLDLMKQAQVNIPLKAVTGEARGFVVARNLGLVDALEVFLEAFEGPLDLLLYLIQIGRASCRERVSSPV